MGKNRLGTDIVTQVGFVVRDIEESSKAFADLLGVEIPDWHWTDGYETAQTEFRGAPSEARAKLAFFSCGQVSLELIEPDEHPSTWREFLDEHGDGVHHIAFVVDGMKSIVSGLESAGMPPIQRGEYTGGRYAYMETQSSLKTIIELLERD